MRKAFAVSLCLIFLPAIVRAESPSSAAAPVTVDNFVRAETDNYLATNAKEAGIGKLSHRREPSSIDQQTVIRLNRDTLYSFGVFDLGAGPVTVTLPNAGKRFMSLQIINEDHYVPLVAYDHKPHTLTEKNVGTRYAMVAIRTLVDPNDPKDLEQAHQLQDAIKVTQQDSGKLELPSWDQTSLKEIRDTLLALAKHTDGFSHAFGARDQVDPIKHLIGTAAGWGGNPDKDATYIGANVPKNDGTTVYKLHVRDVPVDAFWSVSVYDAAGYFESNPYSAYSLNNITAKKDPDGAVTVQFGGCDGKIPNCLPIMPGWNYTVRLYRPRPEILTGQWKFPNPEPIS
ncbi:MAG TPA: DUF1254 domain-containing protein [Methylocella sp.]|nr:DUF1254 domain-containing protein [Methylocella sp.]